MTAIAARRERERLCDLLLELGPDQPTLCEGWTTHDLAAHLVARERRLDVMAAIGLRRFDDHRDRVRAHLTSQPFDRTVAALREGPPRWSPMSVPRVDELVNTAEFFVHHEDVRRGQPDTGPRELDTDLADHLHRLLSSRVGMFTRRLSCGLMLEPDGYSPILARRGLPMVTVRGSIGEVVLFLFGRGADAQVVLDVPDGAPDGLADRLRSATFAA